MPGRFVFVLFGVAAVGFLAASLAVPSAATFLDDGLTRITNDPAAGRHPTWSPDGSQIAFHSDRTGNWEVWTIPAAGGTARQVTNYHRRAYSPDWSPDGSRIAFDSDDSGNWDLWVIPPDAGPATQISTDPADDRRPDWSPAGSQIAFHSTRSGIWDIWVMNWSGPVRVQSESWGHIKSRYRE